MTIERKILLRTAFATAAVLLPVVAFAAGSGGGGSSGSGTGRTDLNAFGCTQDVWECGTWEEECGLDGVQSRSCVMSLDCPNVATPPKPAETRSCTTECREDTWTCGAWGSCIARAQQRVCTKSFDCPLVETPSPATSAKCSVDCGLDQWSCGAWSACVAGTRTRTCVLRENCEDRGAVKPAEREACSASAPTPVPKTTAKPTTKPAAPVVTPSAPSGLVCGNLATLAERVRCRLGLSDEAMEKELAIQYLPEECRAIKGAVKGVEGIKDIEADSERCVERYRNLRPCWTKPIGAERLACVREVLQIRLPVSASACVFASESIEYDRRMTDQCYRHKLYPYITFRFYDLEERAEGLLELGAPMDAVVSFVTTAEQGKIDFNTATTTADRITIIRRGQSAWRTFVGALPYSIVERARKEGVGSGY